jgi:hypothetical protein
VIITTSKHGRTPGDSANLIEHLFKPENDSVEVLEIGNSVATDLAGAIRDMEVLRDGSKASAAFHHASINPSQNCSKKQLLEAANRVRLELDPDGQRVYAIVCHTKKRAVEGAPIHAHLVLANVDANGRALKDGRSKIRTECVARICEFELRETPTLGRHHKSALKLLAERNLPLVRAWLVEAFGEDPERPRSAMSADTRQRAKRQGLDLPQAKAVVADVWSVTGTMETFKTGLKAKGYVLAPGKKEDVWVVFDADGRMIGAVDRLLHKKRQEICHLMENPNERAITQIQPRSKSHVDRARPETLRSVKGDRRASEPVDAAFGPAGSNRSGPGSRPDRANPEVARNPSRSGAASHRATSGRGRKAGIPFKKYEYQRALKLLRAVGARFPHSASISEFMARDAPTPMFDPLWDIWGIPIEPPKRSPP